MHWLYHIDKTPNVLCMANERQAFGPAFMNCLRRIVLVQPGWLQFVHCVAITSF